MTTIDISDPVEAEREEAEEVEGREEKEEGEEKDEEEEEEKESNRDRYTAEFKLEAVRQSREQGRGGVVTVAQALGISHTTLSHWRRDEAKLVIENDRVGPEKPRQGKRFVSLQDEEELVEWYQSCAVRPSEADIEKELKKSHPHIFALGGEDAKKAAKKVSNWVYAFRKRHNFVDKTELLEGVQAEVQAEVQEGVNI